MTLDQDIEVVCELDGLERGEARDLAEALADPYHIVEDHSDRATYIAWRGDDSTTVAETPDEVRADGGVTTAATNTMQRSLYERGHPVSLSEYVPTDFVADIIDFADIAFDTTDARLAHIREGEPLAALLVFPDDTRLFVGEDDTARDRGQFGFVIEADAAEAPATAIEALDLLQPSAVEHADADPVRQGEWFMLPVQGFEPAGSIFKGGVSSRPFDGSPLENHVPTEYGFGVTDETLVERARGHAPNADLGTPKDVVRHAWNQQQFEDDPMIETPNSPLTMDVVREIAETVYVRGTLRHRENDHYLASIGDTWHVAHTHGQDVCTPDTGPATDYPEYREQDNGYWERTSSSGAPLSGVSID